jgi:hypothetical protein
MNENAGIFSAFIWAITPLAIIRGGQTLAETIVLPLVVFYLFFLFCYIRNNDLINMYIMGFLLFSIIVSHNLTGAVLVFFSFVILLFKYIKNKNIFAIALLTTFSIIFVSIIYYFPASILPNIEETYDVLYKVMKEYITSQSVGSRTYLPWGHFDLIFFTSILAISGLFFIFYKKNRYRYYLLISSLILFIFTQLFRFNFNFAPHRFIIYLLIILTIVAGIGLSYLLFDIKNHKMRCLYITGIVIACVLLFSNAMLFQYDFKFLMEDEDFQSLSWGRSHLDGHVVTYSKINNTRQNKYASLLNNPLEFHNDLFVTNDVDFDLMNMISSIFGIPLESTPNNDKIVYGIANDPPFDNEYVDLSGKDRTDTSLNITTYFWKAPSSVILSDDIEYEEAIRCGKRFNLPVILYSEEHEKVIIDLLRRWHSDVVLYIESDSLIRTLDYYDICHYYEPKEKLEVSDFDGYIYFSSYNVEPLIDATNKYLYISYEATRDHVNILSYVNGTKLNKIFQKENTTYYYKN